MTGNDIDVTSGHTGPDPDPGTDPVTAADIGDAEPVDLYARVIRILEGLPLLIEHTRRRRGVTFEEAAGELGMSAKHLVRLERDDANPNRATIVAILKWVSK